MQFFWKHLHNNKGDENVSKLIWIVIAFVIGALLLSTMSVAFRTEGAIGGWLSSSLEEWFGEADGRDGSVGGGTGGSGGGLPGGNTGEGGGNEATSLEGIVMSYDETIGALTSDNDKNNGNKYTTLFTEMSGTVYETSVYYSPNGATTSGDNLLLPEATVIDVSSVPSPYKEMFATGTKVISVNDPYDNTFYIGVDIEGNAICPMPSNPVGDGEYVVFSAEDNSPIVLTWNDANSTLMSSGKDYTDMFTGLTEGLSYAVTAYPSASNGSNVDETDSVLGEEYAVAEPAVDPYQTGTMMLKASNGVTTGVDTSGNILVMKAARPSTGNAVYSQGTDGFENVEPDEDNTVHNGTVIPEGATYYTGVTSSIIDYTSGAKLDAGTNFPVPQYGDVYIYGDYEYRYKQDIWMSDWRIMDSGMGSGWGVKVLNETKSEYGPILESINNQPVKSLRRTFQNCELFIKAPSIPSGVTDMSGTFYNCKSLTEAPVIPNGVTNMEITFHNCTSLKKAPEIPNSVINMRGTFFGCESLTEAPEIPNGVTNMNDTFGNCYKLIEAPTIPSGVTSMSQTFAWCESLTKAPIIPNGVKDMRSTFNSCKALIEAPVIPDSVTDMTQTFRSCTSLEKAPEIPASVTDMEHLFNNCKSLAGDIQINSRNITNAKYAFNSTINSLIIKVPANSTTYTTLVNSNPPSNITIETF